MERVRERSIGRVEPGDLLNKLLGLCTVVERFAEAPRFCGLRIVLIMYRYFTQPITRRTRQ
jgi:hypothetical protein